MTTFTFSPALEKLKHFANVQVMENSRAGGLKIPQFRLIDILVRCRSEEARCRGEIALGNLCSS